MDAEEGSHAGLDVLTGEPGAGIGYLITAEHPEAEFIDLINYLGLLLKIRQFPGYGCSQSICLPIQEGPKNGSLSILNTMRKCTLSVKLE